ncbi:MAG: membrane dipeptidase, partial [Candidatus Dormibacteraceae bacterium]
MNGGVRGWLSVVAGQPRIVVDAHLDLSWNALNWNRDLTLPVSEIRTFEAGMRERNRAGNTVAFPEMRRGGVAVCLGTLLARSSNSKEDKLDYRNQQIACAMAQGQLAYYRLMEEEGQLRMLTDWLSLAAQIQSWKESGSDSAPLGFVLSMEGAGPIISPGHVLQWWDAELRVIGLAHYGASAYAHGTG